MRSAVSCDQSRLRAGPPGGEARRIGEARLPRPQGVGIRGKSSAIGIRVVHEAAATVPTASFRAYEVGSAGPTGPVSTKAVCTGGV
jgi:hypothetical protein